MATFGHIIAIAAGACGFLAWAYLAFGLTYARFFEPEKKRRPSVLPPRTARAVFTVGISGCVTIAALLFGVIALILGDGTFWSWIGVGAALLFWLSFGALILLHKMGLLPKGL